ncbi:tRNA (guanosine(46)-N7)-methyltransferase TrmB [Niabella ginsenosidivorans]|uniref:tRNA (guanine-N(7)-)-methyltransferase n=1 Tax=Niabella ginsenosidivorans TaxID=1176587 RepID=A0A1A9I980_9BACT|nr:tRNA (guanosine(46)-N7)-methyltransferase TrmB [Niabella ginsenosidivorans]ANH83262.1 tRNA (guanosine(46)-N7)-methyltransferase TrmB [Niabella ginsenosidivorans]
MAQKKLVRFTELNTFENVLQFPQNIKGKWDDHFKNDHPIVLELACGKGEYALGLARLYPDKNFIGVDIKGNRLWAGAKKALKEELHNVAFLRVQIEQLQQYFAQGEVREIWITFPDPQLRFSKAKKRLTHPRFLRIYHQLLKTGGLIHLKTDSPNLYRFTKEVLYLYNCTIVKDADDLYKEDALSEELKIKTYYESLDIAESNRIHYLAFQLPPVLADAQKDLELKEAIRYELDSR